MSVDTITVVCDSPQEKAKPTKVAEFSHEQGMWAVTGLHHDSRRPGQPGKNPRAVNVLGSGVVTLPPHLRCKLCGERLQLIDTDILNRLVRQGVSRIGIRELKVLNSSQR